MSVPWPVQSIFRIAKEPRVSLLEHYAAAQGALGHKEKELELRCRAVLLRASKYGSSANNTLSMRFAFAKTLAKYGKIDLALEQFRLVVSDSSALPMSDKGLAGHALYRIAVLLRDAGRYNEALEALAEARPIYEALGSEGYALSSQLLVADLLSRNGYLAEAIEITTRVRDELRLLRGESDPYSLNATLQLASRLHQAGEEAEARRITLGLLEAGKNSRRKEGPYRDLLLTEEERAVDPNRTLRHAEELLRNIENGLSPNGSH